MTEQQDQPHDPEGAGGYTPKIPRHVAIIMDGNGRWARQRGLPRIRGHEEGAQSVAAALRACRDIGVEFLTLYAFSVENWTRPHTEIAGLMRLLRRFLKEREAELHEHRIRLRITGRLSDLPTDVRRALLRVMKETAAYTRHQVILALSYGGRAELIDAVQAIARRVRDGTLAPDEIDESTLAAHLYCPDVPDPDLMIRTSGEIRLSNFLLWQLSYAELYFCETLWPNFREADFRQAVEEYGRRRRRFGDIEPKSLLSKIIAVEGVG